MVNCILQTCFIFYVYCRNYSQLVHCIFVVPSAPPQNITSEVINSTVILIFWNPPPLVNQNGIITSYQVMITNLNKTNSSAITINTNTTSYVAMGLQINTLYNFEVAAMTIIGLGPFSDPVSSQTFEDGQFLFAYLLCMFLFICMYM